MRGNGYSHRRFSYCNSKTAITYDKQSGTGPLYSGQPYATCTQPYGRTLPTAPAQGYYPGYTYYPPQGVVYPTAQNSHQWQQRPSSVAPHRPEEQQPPPVYAPSAPGSAYLNAPKDQSGGSKRGSHGTTSHSVASRHTKSSKSKKDEVIQAWATTVSQSVKPQRSVICDPSDAGLDDDRRRKKKQAKSRGGSSYVPSEHTGTYDEYQVERRYGGSVDMYFQQDKYRDRRPTRKPTGFVYQREIWGAIQHN
jgi:hypothetical protein